MEFKFKYQLALAHFGGEVSFPHTVLNFKLTL